MSEPVGHLRVLVKAEGWGGSRWTGRGEPDQEAWVPCSCAQSVPGPAELRTGRPLLWRKPAAQGRLGSLTHPALPPKVYKGYVDDPRNTDNAWIETVAVSVHFPDQSDLELKRLNSVWGSGCRLPGWGDVGPTWRGIMGSWARTRAVGDPEMWSSRSPQACTVYTPLWRYCEFGSVQHVPNPELGPPGPGNRPRPLSAGWNPRMRCPLCSHPRAFGLCTLSGCLCSHVIKAQWRPREGGQGNVWGAGCLWQLQRQDVPFLAAPARRRPRDVRPMAGRGQAHLAVRQPQGHPAEGGHSVRGLLLTPGPTGQSVPSPSEIGLQRVQLWTLGRPGAQRNGVWGPATFQPTGVPHRTRSEKGTRAGEGWPRSHGISSGLRWPWGPASRHCLS